jgi:hypothetical protein
MFHAWGHTDTACHHCPALCIYVLLTLVRRESCKHVSCKLGYHALLVAGPLRCGWLVTDTSDRAKVVGNQTMAIDAEEPNCGVACRGW